MSTLPIATPWARQLPLICILYRFVAGPGLLWAAWQGHKGAFVSLFVLAFISDVVDGMIARRLQVVTSRLREADSRADLSLYLCVIAAIWLVHPDVLVEFWVPLTFAIAAQGLQWLTGLIKYGHLPSYHSYSAKLWGVSLAIATVALFAFDYAGITFLATLLIGTLHNLEEVAMTFILPTWTFDVKTIQKAGEIRRETLNEERLAASLGSA
ncbi:MAG: CDP-alcohol phosphatidyltransferase family protein [Cyanobacteria bacterium J06635_15]